MQEEIKQNWFFRQSPEEVWEYLTKPELLEQWLMKADLQPIVGHKFRFTYTPKEGSNYEGFVDCEVLEAEPVTKLSYSWKGNTKDRKRSFDSKVVWTLIPKENGTELQLQHKGFTVSEDFTTHSNGWATCVKRLEGIINTITP